MLHQNPRRQCGLSIAKWQRLCSLIDIFLRIPELAVYFTYINDPDGDYEDRVDLFLNRHGDEFWSDAEQGLWRLSDDSTGGRDMIRCFVHDLLTEGIRFLVPDATTTISNDEQTASTRPSSMGLVYKKGSSSCGMVAKTSRERFAAASRKRAPYKVHVHHSTLSRRVLCTECRQFSVDLPTVDLTEIMTPKKLQLTSPPSYMTPKGCVQNSGTNVHSSPVTESRLTELMDCIMEQSLSAQTKDQTSDPNQCTTIGGSMLGSQSTSSIMAAVSPGEVSLDSRISLRLPTIEEETHEQQGVAYDGMDIDSDTDSTLSSVSSMLDSSPVVKVRWITFRVVLAGDSPCDSVLITGNMKMTLSELMTEVVIKLNLDMDQVPRRISLESTRDAHDRLGQLYVITLGVGADLDWLVWMEICGWRGGLIEMSVKLN